MRKIKNRKNRKSSRIVIFGLVFTGLLVLGMTWSNQSVYAAWIQTEDGKTAYQDENGQFAIGFQVIDGNRYYFDEQGILQTGKFYVKSEDAYYFSDEKGIVSMGGVIPTKDGFYQVDENGKIQKGFVDYNQARYYFNEKAEIVTGWYKVDGNWYYADDAGRMVTGLATIDGYRFYFDTNGIRVSNTVMDIDGVTYVFNADGSVDENATALYSVYQNVAAIRQSFSLGELRQDSKVQACAILRAGGLKDGYSNTVEGEMETLLKNRGVKCNNGYEFAYGGIEGYDVGRLIQDMGKDTNLNRALQDEAVTAIGIGMSQQDNLSYYDIILICE